LLKKPCATVEVTGVIPAAGAGETGPLVNEYNPITETPMAMPIIKPKTLKKYLFVFM
jgi:hypothetical protein